MVGVLCRGCGEMLRACQETCHECGTNVPGPHGATPADVVQAEKNKSRQSGNSGDNHENKKRSVPPGPHGAPPQDEDEIVVPGPHGAPPSFIPR